jgi:tetratricopeptide (TPR) repeat protein
MHAFLRFACFAAMLALAPGTSYGQTPDDCFKAGLQDDDAKLIRICTQVLEKGGIEGATLSTTISNRGLGYLRNKEYDKAIIDFSEAVLINPKNPFAFDNRGDAWREKGNYERALADYAEAIAIDPAFGSAYLNRGITYELQGDKAKARAEYQRALDLKGDRPIDQWARRQAKTRLDKLGR